MFNFRTTSITFILLFLGLIVFSTGWFSFVLLTILYIVVLGLGSFIISLNFYISSINQIPNHRKQIAITFDDGPTPKTLEVLKVLTQWNAKATFFCIGSQVIKHPDILKEIVAQGHLVGNHTFSHQNTFPFFSQNKMLEDVERASEEIEKLVGVRPLFFRPPFGVTNPRIAKMLEQTKLKSIGWNKRSLDTTIKLSSKILKRVTTNLQPGDIILFHDRMPNSATTLGEFFRQTSGRGFEFERLDKILAAR